MLSVKLICVGKLKESFWTEACKEYEKRMKTMCRLEVLQLEVLLQSVVLQLLLQLQL